MRLLTLLALAAIGAGIYQYRNRRARSAAPQATPDEMLAENVRSGIAGAASSPVDVRVVNGTVSLRGTVRKAERDRVLAAALAVPGVTQVGNFLETHEPVGELGTMQSGTAAGV
jgi:osmotically-inducible protein OsmY